MTEKTFALPHCRCEAHAIALPADALAPFADQLADVDAQIEALRGRGLTPMLVRYFLSDAANQAALLGCGQPWAVSVVEQPPLGGAKVGAWVWAAEGVEPRKVDDGPTRVDAFVPGVDMLLLAGDCRPGATSADATRAMLLSLAERLPSLGRNCLRTWLFVRDVDVNYAGAVAGRNDAFARCGLRERYIASTGINGAQADASVAVSLDALCYLGLPDGAVRFLEARSHLNPTREYGVAFERAVAVDFPGGPCHVYVSGTASINNRGEIVHPGDVRAQTLRMLENVDALLAEGGCTRADAAHAIVYLRDAADYPLVSALLARELPNVPTIVVRAPVCRPGWLIEMECMAVRSR